MLKIEKRINEEWWCEHWIILLQIYSPGRGVIHRYLLRTQDASKIVMIREMKNTKWQKQIQKVAHLSFVTGQTATASVLTKTTTILITTQWISRKYIIFEILILKERTVLQIMVHKARISASQSPNENHFSRMNR